MLIGVIGNGFVGQATVLLECSEVQLIVYDIDPLLCKPVGTELMDLLECECIFISVPTPMKANGECFIDIVEKVVNNLRDINYMGFIVIRSTIPIGTCDRLKCYFMPEFLTERNFCEDFKQNKDWIFGVLDSSNDDAFKKTITKLFTLSYLNNKILNNNIHFVLNKEAEMVKLFRNCILATKVSFCNEINELYKLKDINYENVRKLACADKRILHSHSKVPGPDGKYGFGGTCFPKDTNSLRHQMKQVGMKGYVLNAIIERNDIVDRREKDWEKNLGRAVVDDSIQNK